MAFDPYKGEGIQLSFKKEVTYAEAVTSGAQTLWLGIIPSYNIDVVPEFKDYFCASRGAASLGRDIFIEKQGRINCNGSFPLEVQNGRILYWAMGGYGVSAPSGLVYTHSISGAATVPSWIAEIDYGGTNAFRRYARGCKVNKLTIEGAEGAEVRGTVNFINSRTDTTSNSLSSVTTVTTKPFMYYDGTFTYNNDATFKITSFSWSVDNKLKPYFTVESTGQYCTFLTEQRREYELKVTLLLSDNSSLYNDFYNDLIAGTNRTAKIKLARDASTDYMELTATNCTVRSAPHNVPETGEAVEVDITLKPRTCTWSCKDTLAQYQYFYADSDRSGSLTIGS